MWFRNGLSLLAEVSLYLQMWHPNGEYSWKNIFPQGILYCVIIITMIMIIVMSSLDFCSKTSCTALTVWTHLLACLYVPLSLFCNCLDHHRTLCGPGCHLVFNSLLTLHCICRCHILHFAVCWLVSTFVFILQPASVNPPKTKIKILTWRTICDPLDFLAINVSQKHT
jgi:hypothetical protein